MLVQRLAKSTECNMQTEVSIILTLQSIFSLSKQTSLECFTQDADLNLHLFTLNVLFPTDPKNWRVWVFSRPDSVNFR